MKKIIFLLLTSCLFSASSFSRSNDTLNTTPQKWRNDIFVQLGGEGLLVTLNYERYFHINEKRRISLRAGIGPLYELNPIIPITLSAISGKKRCFEYGFGVTLVPDDIDPIGFTASAGYRSFGQKGFTFRAGVCLFYIPDGWIEFMPWPSISFGYSFR